MAPATNAIGVAWAPALGTVVVALVDVLVEVVDWAVVGGRAYSVSGMSNRFVSAEKFYALLTSRGRRRRSSGSARSAGSRGRSGQGRAGSRCFGALDGGRSLSRGLSRRRRRRSVGAGISGTGTDVGELGGIVEKLVAVVGDLKGICARRNTLRCPGESTASSGSCVIRKNISMPVYGTKKTCARD